MSSSAVIVITRGRSSFARGERPRASPSVKALVTSFIVVAAAATATVVAAVTAAAAAAAAARLENTQLYFHPAFPIYVYCPARSRLYAITRIRPIAKREHVRARTAERPLSLNNEEASSSSFRFALISRSIPKISCSRRIFVGCRWHR